MDLVMQGIVAGLLVGGVYAIVAIGLAVQFSVMGVINFAQGVFVMLGAYVALFLSKTFGLHPYAGAVVSFAALFGLGWLLMRVLIQRLSSGELALPLIATFGIAVAIQNVVVATDRCSCRYRA
jgi:branched-chain amino acid transport system permease protein